MKKPLSLAVSTTITSTLMLQGALAIAQKVEGAESASMLEEVIVTARKRQESLQEVPVAISVFGRDDILEQDLRNLENIAEHTPGFQFLNQGNQQPGRYNTQLQFRGLTTAQFSPSFATGALFIDGIYVLNGGTSLSLMDVERVEVIKGPQAAYFGRNTFGGAVNLITRDPNAGAFGGELNISSTDRGTSERNILVEGPVINDVLAFSLGGRFYDKRGQFTASDDGRLGNEKTSAYNAVLNWTPAGDFSLKVRYGYAEDEDGAPAGAYVSGLLNDTCTGKTVNSAEGPAMPQNYICGKVPYGSSVNVDAGAKVISSNTILPADLSGLTDPATNLSDVPNVTRIGMQRETERLSLAASYTFADDYSLDLSYGNNQQYANWIRDFDLTDRLGWWSRDPQSMEDESYEIRLTGPQDGRLRWLVGYNYYEQEFISSGSGGDAATSCFSLAADITDAYPDACVYSFFDPAIGGLGIGRPGLNSGLGIFRNGLGDRDEAEVTGIFIAIDFDITDTLTAIFEGRQVKDELTKGSTLALNESYDKFLPRVILRYEPAANTNIYLSYSEGHIAGDFNVEFSEGDASEREQYLAQDPGLQEALEAETLDAWELGWKQGFGDGKGQLNIALYHQTWLNIKGRSTFVINETCRAADVGEEPGCDSVGLLKTNDDGTPFFNSRNQLIPGDATIWGVELEAWYAATENLMFNFNLSHINSEYDDYVFNFVAPIAGFSQMKGNQTPRQPKLTTSAAVTYHFMLGSNDSYVRADWFHQGKSYVDESNLAYIPGYDLLNLRAGMEVGNALVELFITNATDEEAWQTGARWTDFSSPTQFAYLTSKQGVALSPLNKRELGIRFNYRL